MEVKLPLMSTNFYSIITSASTQKPLKHKTQLTKPFKNPQFFPHKPLKSNSTLNPPQNSTYKTTLFVEKYHLTQQLDSLIHKLKDGNLSPLQLLQDDGDWNKSQFWAVVKFLRESSRIHEILEVFNAWIKLEQGRINELSYKKIIGLLSEAGMTDEAALELQNMKNYGLELCPEVYNSIINGYAQIENFDEALRYLNEMQEMNVNADTETFDGLIKGYGKFQMYDEMVNCVKMMEQGGCSPDHITYNLLICELSKGGLVNRMERMYHTLVSKRKDLQSSTLVAMLEAYADFGVLEKMEIFYLKARNSKTILKERLIKKIARVYAENLMFSRLEDLGNDVAIKIGRTNLFWCLCLLSQACQLSKKGMNTVIQQMEEENVSWNVTFANIISWAHLKMKDFKMLEMTLSELPYKHVQPDIVTIGILYDGYNIGFDWSSTLRIWRKYGYLKNGVDLRTDSLVSPVLGKGLFLKAVEEMHSLLDPETREEKTWTYEGLLDFVLKHHEKLP